MTNRFSCNPVSAAANRRADSLIRFDKEQLLTFGTDLDVQLLELEQRQSCKTVDLQVRQEILAAAEPVTYDDFGLVEGLEIDVSWM